MNGTRALLLTVAVAVGFVGCGGRDANREAAPATTTPATSPPDVASPTIPSAGSSTTRGTTVDIYPPDTTVYTTDTLTSPPKPTPVDRRALLELRAAEFELLDPRRDPARYLAMSTAYCRGLVDEEHVRRYGTAAATFGEAEERRLDLLDRGTRVIGTNVFGYRSNAAQVEVRLDGERVDQTVRTRYWFLEGANWQVESCRS